MRALIVEDDLRLRQMLSHRLRLTGFTAIDEAGDGVEALTLLAAIRPNLILAECQMPRMGGIGIVRALRQQGDATPIIMLCRHVRSHRVALAVMAGADNYFPLSASLELLREKITQAFASRRPADES